MTPQDLRIFCTALGFTAVVMGGSEDVQNDAQRALVFANLIETFCKRAVPGLDEADMPDSLWRVDRMIEEMKSDLRAKGAADMQKDRVTLFRLYGRLRERYASYATDDMVAQRILELLSAEITHVSAGV